LPRVPDWRWLLDREDSPWYPSMRLFRQQEMGQWEPVFARMTEELRRLARAHVAVSPKTTTGKSSHDANVQQAQPASAPAARLEAARRSHQTGDYRRAEQLYGQILEADPGNGQVWYLRAAALQALGRLEDAAAASEQALRQRPEHGESHNL